MRTLPIPADAHLLARNAARLARSIDPVSIADAFGLAVYRASRAECGGSASVIVGNTVLVAEDADVSSAVGLAVGLHLVDRWRVQVTDPHGLAGRIAGALAELGRAAIAAA